MSGSDQPSASSVLMSTLTSQVSTVSFLNHNEDSGVVVYSIPHTHSLAWWFLSPKCRQKGTACFPVNLGHLKHQAKN